MAHNITFSGIEEYLAPYAPFFRRAEGKELAKCYATGLMMEGERKSVEPMSERVHASDTVFEHDLGEYTPFEDKVKAGPTLGGPRKSSGWVCTFMKDPRSPFIRQRRRRCNGSRPARPRTAVSEVSPVPRLSWRAPTGALGPSECWAARL